MQDDPNKARIAANVRKMDAAGAPLSDIEDYIRSEGLSRDPGPSEWERGDRAARRQAESDAERASLNTPATSFVNFLDAGTFGLAGLGTDALSPGSFRANRDARDMIYEGLPSGERVALGVAGSVANPVKSIVPLVGKGVGLLRTAGRLARPFAEGAVQGGAQMAGENIGTTEGAGDATATGAVFGGLLGGGTGAALRAAGGVGRKLGFAYKVATSEPLDKVAFELEDAMRRQDDLLYGAVRHEAGQSGSSPAIRDVLDSKTIRPFARMIRNSERFANADDATTLIESYKQMSAAQRGAAKAQEGTAKFLAKNKLKVDDIGIAKGRMLDAAEAPGEVVVPGRTRTAPPPTTAQSPAPSVRDAIEAYRTRSGQVATRAEGTTMQQKAREALARHGEESVVSPSLSGAPSEFRAVVRESQTVPVPGAITSLRPAIEAHRASAGRIDAFNRVGNAVQDILGGTGVRGEKLTLGVAKGRIGSPEALRRAIDRLTPPEAEAALGAAYGRGREAIRFTANPVGDFGVRPSLFRAIRTPFQLDEFITALEAKAGRKPSRLSDVYPELARRSPGVVGRLGGLLAP